MGEFEAAGEIVTGGLLGRAMEPRAGEGHAGDGVICLNCGTALVGSHCHQCGQSGHVHRSLSGIGHELVHGVFHFEGKFWREVGRNLVEEKIFRRLHGQGGPDSQALRAGRTNIHAHLDYVGWLSMRRNWLAGDRFSLADIAAAAHLSVVDYVGDVPWSEHEDAKLWYQRVKSRPSFRPLLTDLLPGAPPPSHYADLDF